MKDGPANQAGLLPGDVVTHVEGESVASLGYYVAIDKIKGTEGTEVTITYERNGKSSIVTLVREKITVESVIYTRHETEKDVGIIRIIEFNNSTPQQFKNAINQAIKVDGCKSLVYDLRGNPGGTLTSVVEMLDFLLPSGTIVTVRYADGTEQKHYSDNSGEEFISLYGSNIKMAVLTNGYTASAAELFTCALKDYELATVVGEKTFGKGCGQSVVPLSDGSGLAFTTFLYDPPVSENYNGKGIIPNIEKKLSEEAAGKNLFDLAHSEDDQLKAAVEALK
jgi:carboxyl-terminal processing protease